MWLKNFLIDNHYKTIYFSQKWVLFQRGEKVAMLLILQEVQSSPFMYWLLPWLLFPLYISVSPQCTQQLHLHWRFGGGGTRNAHAPSFGNKFIHFHAVFGKKENPEFDIEMIRYYLHFRDTIPYHTIYHRNHNGTYKHPSHGVSKRNF